MLAFIVGHRPTLLVATDPAVRHWMRLRRNERERGVNVIRRVDPLLMKKSFGGIRRPVLSLQTEFLDPLRTISISLTLVTDRALGQSLAFVGLTPRKGDALLNWRVSKFLFAELTGRRDRLNPYCRGVHNTSVP